MSSAPLVCRILTLICSQQYRRVLSRPRLPHPCPVTLHLLLIARVTTHANIHTIQCSGLLTACSASESAGRLATCPPAQTPICLSSLQCVWQLYQPRALVDRLASKPPRLRGTSGLFCFCSFPLGINPSA
ncbi:hypothetical protein BC835DRAFT_455681 [Cytidiella melzeri]|nr:hypothetical protein BC835DRAFT_455681 [Cytidiella melzeri]